jgi:Arm DNA-binding domain
MPNLTEKFIANLGPREGKRQYDVYGPRSSGLGLCYSNGGARTWFVFWRDAEGKNRRTSIGRHDKDVSVKEAKRRARAKLEEIATEIKAGINRPTNAPTMGDLIDRYLEHAADHVAPSTLVQVKGITQRCFTQELRAQKLKKTSTATRLRNFMGLSGGHAGSTRRIVGIGIRVT